MSDKTVNAFALRTFKDAGTNKRVEKGSVIEIGEGEFGNYEAAGLVRAPSDAEVKAAAPEKPTTSGKPDKNT